MGAADNPPNRGKISKPGQIVQGNEWEELFLQDNYF